MATYNNSVINKFDTGENGNAGTGASVTVYLAGTTTKASITHDSLDPTSNPMFADSNGNYSFEVSSGTYDIVINEGNLSEQRLDSTLIGEVVFSDYPQTITAPYTFQVPSINDNGVFISTYFIDGVAGDNGGVTLQANGAYILNEFDRSNNNTGTSLTRVTTEAGAEARITKRLTVDDWSASGTIDLTNVTNISNTLNVSATTDFTGNVDFNSSFITHVLGSNTLFAGFANFQAGGNSYIDSGHAFTTDYGFDFVHEGEPASTYTNLRASSTGLPVWGGDEIPVTTNNITWSGTNTFNNNVTLTAPMSTNAPITMTSPPNINAGSLWNGVFIDETAGLSGSTVLQANGVPFLNQLTLSNANNIVDTDRAVTNVGWWAIAQANLGDAAFDNKTSPSATLWDDGNLIKVGDVSTNAIIETGTNTNGTYTKWADGTMKCVKSLTISDTANIAFGSLFISPLQALGAWPETFTSILYSGLTASRTGNAPIDFQIGANQGTTTNAPSGWFVSPVSISTAENLTVQCIGWGRWN